MAEPDFDGYHRYIKDLSIKQSENASQYDKALLTLSSAFLGLSITFINHVVPLKESKHLGLIFVAWTLFALTIILTIASFIYGQRVIRVLWGDAKQYFVNCREQNDTELEIFYCQKPLDEKSARLTKYLDRLNTSSGIFFIIGVVLIVLFVSLNLNQEKIMITKQTQGTETRGQPVTPLGQAPQKPSTSSSSQSQQTGSQSSNNSK